MVETRARPTIICDGTICEASTSGAPSDLRDEITRRFRASEADCVDALVAVATLPGEVVARAGSLAGRLVETLRAKGTRGPVEGLMREYDLSSQEGVALMCLAEALLRIPDRATRDALIRDKVGAGRWREHVGHSSSLFVNAATWGLVLTGKLTGTANEGGLAAALTRLIASGGEPLIRKGVDLAMRMMGQQFVAGQTITEALGHARRLEARGFRYSYDMLGEAATTADDAARYTRDYEWAIHAIGAAAAGRGPIEGPGISVKLSALHPRYARSQRERVTAELLPRLRSLALLASRYNIGLNIDAEESERLDLSLDLLEALCLDPALAGWQGIGFVVQAYGKRAPFVLDWVIDLARRSRHRLMVRLVKGAYWDSEIKRAQQDGLVDFPVFTRKAHTDVSYIACARKLLDAPDAVFAQLATHNAYTVAVIHSMAGDAEPDAYEFQCLHGMGEPLYDEVVGHNKLNRPCRVYAPVNTHETLLAYLVRRLLENGANSSFVNRVADPAVSVAELVDDPVAAVISRLPVGVGHERIALPRDLFGAERPNARGLDLSNEHTLASLADASAESAAVTWRAEPTVSANGSDECVRNPADRRDVVGHVMVAMPSDVDVALARADRAVATWQATPPAQRAACLRRGADTLEERMPTLVGLLAREAGKTLPNAVAEVREAVDFLRYYAAQAEGSLNPANHRSLGVVACISPWNFPLAIFTGQVAAALAAGNTVLAKPAEQTPLIAAQAVVILHEAGVPTDVLQLLPGHGEVGARLVADPCTRGVVFTGSTKVARLIARELAERLNPDGGPVPLIAETGGQNVLVVASSALAEQVVADVLTSAFDSAGQRCSALRVLCLQEEVADRTFAMLRGAVAELSVGDPGRLATDIGPVIDEEARSSIAAHVEAMRDADHAVHQAPLPDACAHGTFVAPTIIEIDGLPSLTREVFGPVLHVLRFQRDGLDDLIAAINATGYGLTFGVQSRVDETIVKVTARASAGNLYVNRNLIGAVVGVQPFGGHGLSGTGPKAGGPLYLRHLMAPRPPLAGPLIGRVPSPARAWADWLAQNGERSVAEGVLADLAATPVGVERELPGPVGERNVYGTEGRGTVLCTASRQVALFRQIGTALATGNRALIAAGALAEAAALPVGLDGWLVESMTPEREEVAAALFEGDAGALRTLNQNLANRPGAIVPIHVAGPNGAYPLEWLVRERSISTNTAAAGGNASLMMIG